MTFQFRSADVDVSKTDTEELHASLREKHVSEIAAFVPGVDRDGGGEASVAKAARGVRGAFQSLLSRIKTGPRLKQTAARWFGRKLRRAQAAMRLNRQRREARRARLAAAAARVSGLDVRMLEPRVVFDGAGAATADAVVETQQDAPADIARAAEGAAQTAASAAEVTEAAIATVPTDNEVGQALVFVDAGVEDSASILATLDASAEVVMIDRDNDGVVQIAAALNGRTNIDAIHIISHGEAGELRLGSATLTEASMRGEHADALATIGAALSSNADILIYGCDFGADAQGASAVETFKELTGADIAASDDDTGHADLGGDWDLEVEAG
ncbi:MAG: DUF4347 domain-containing protein, partial [Pseudomonadota bacterium]